MTRSRDLKWLQQRDGRWHYERRILTAACRIGAAPVDAFVASLEELVHQQVFDEETDIPTFPARARSRRGLGL